jgi:hypothetical protein
MTSNNKEFNIADISLSDEGMEDLETFNLKFGEKINELNKKNENLSLNHNLINKPLGLIESNNNSKFSVKQFFNNCLINLNKKQLKKLINELGKFEELNFDTLSLIKSHKSRNTKEKLIEIINKVIIELIKTKNINY